MATTESSADVPAVPAVQANTEVPEPLLAFLPQSNLPLIVPQGDITQDELQEWALAKGFSIYLTLGEQVDTKQVKTGNVTRTETTVTPSLYKVVNNLAGRATVKVTTGDLGLPTFTEKAFSALPKIPLHLIERMDTFFRKIDADLGTEAIVILTYDPSYRDTDNPSDGWGVAVPKQTNTAGSCDYDQTSVIDDLPDGVYQVGSAHSHPGMSAFASHTDHGDQANFDGVHITFGWSKHTRVTDFHIELQQAGVAWTLKPEQIFQAPDDAVAEDPTIAEWAERVKKAPPPPTTSSATGRGAGGTRYGAGRSNGGSGWSTPKVAHDTNRTRYPGLPSWAPSPREVTLVVSPLETRERLTDCPICHESLSSWDKENFKCAKCTSYIKPLGYTWEGMVAARRSKHMPYRDLDFPATADHTVVLLEQAQPKGATPLWTKKVMFDPDDKTTWVNNPYPHGGAGTGRAGGSGKADAGAGPGGPWTVCPECFELSGPDDLTCWACKAELASSPDTVMSAHFARIDAAFAAEIPMLCCERDDADCDCSASDALAFDEALTIFDQLSQDRPMRIYQPGGGCASCVLQWTGHCPPLREWLRDWIHRAVSAEPPAQLERCDAYLPNLPDEDDVPEPDDPDVPDTQNTEHST